MKKNRKTVNGVLGQEAHFSFTLHFIRPTANFRSLWNLSQSSKDPVQKFVPFATPLLRRRCHRQILKVVWVNHSREAGNGTHTHEERLIEGLTNGQAGKKAERLTEELTDRGKDSSATKIAINQSQAMIIVYLKEGL